MKLTQQELKNNSPVIFDNAHLQNEEAFEIELDFSQLATWDNPFKLFVNGELEASYKSFAALCNRAEKLITEHRLERVKL